MSFFACTLGQFDNCRTPGILVLTGQVPQTGHTAPKPRCVEFLVSAHILPLQERCVVADLD